MQSLSNVETKRTHYGELFPYIYSTLLLFWISQGRNCNKRRHCLKKKRKENSIPTFHLINFKKIDGLMMQ